MPQYRASITIQGPIFYKIASAIYDAFVDAKHVHSAFSKTHTIHHAHQTLEVADPAMEPTSGDPQPNAIHPQGKWNRPAHIIGSVGVAVRCDVRLRVM